MSQFSTRPPISPLCSYLSAKYSTVNIRKYKTDELAEKFQKGMDSSNQDRISYQSFPNKASYRRLAFTSAVTTPDSDDNKPFNTTFDVDEDSDKKNAKQSKFSMNVTFDLEDKSELFVKSKHTTNLNETFDIEEPTLTHQSIRDKIKLEEKIETVDNESSEVNPLSRSYPRHITYNVPKHNSFLGSLNSDKKPMQKLDGCLQYKNVR